VSLISFAAQLLLVGIERSPSWDEAIYLSQVSPDVAALPFVASRARGIVVIVAPLAATGVPLPILRLVLAAASAAAVAGAFQPWIRSLGWGAPAAAAIFCTSWLTIFYGAEVMPNLWSALLAVATSGWVVRASTARPGERTRCLIAAGGAVAALALLRPLDAVALALVFGPFALSADRDVRLAASVAVGTSIGVLVWVVEMAARAGGAGAALREAVQAGHVAAAGPFDRLVQHAWLADGPTLGPEVEGNPVFAIVWWTSVLVLVLIAVTARPARPGVRCAALAGAWLLVLYVAAIGGLAPRFLFPGIALLTIPAGAGVVEVWRRRTLLGRRSRRVVTAAVIALGASLVVWNGAIAVLVADATLTARKNDAAAGLAVRTLADGRPCALVATSSFPQLAWASGCRTRPVRPGWDERPWLAANEGDGNVVYVAVRRGDRLPSSSVAPGAELLREVDDWAIYQP
jgi:hypothetical protein